jgi:hypothetical protein
MQDWDIQLAEISTPVFLSANFQTSTPVLRNGTPAPFYRHHLPTASNSRCCSSLIPSTFV